MSVELFRCGKCPVIELSEPRLRQHHADTHRGDMTRAFTMVELAVTVGDGVARVARAMLNAEGKP